MVLEYRNLILGAYNETPFFSEPQEPAIFTGNSW